MREISSRSPFIKFKGARLSFSAVITFAALVLLLSVLIPVNAQQNVRSGLLPGESLNVVQVLQSPNGNYTLRIQRNGEVVIRQGVKEVWTSYTCARPDEGFYLQYGTNGDLAIYNSKNERLSSLASDGVYRMPVDTCLVSSDESALLVMQKDGNLVTCIGYEPSKLWAEMGETAEGDDQPDPDRSHYDIFRGTGVKDVYTATVTNDAKISIKNSKGEEKWTTFPINP
ncbi:MAG: hypothetical protein J3Q66DRAFT_408364 [Benniella sp.]|nr:MAG: hypothetical protein J3Q66DRAFT_408364 [Benniella sp.]